MTVEAILSMIGIEKLPTTETSPIEVKQPLAEYGLDGVDCPICNNTGQIYYEKDGYPYSRDCECMAKRRSIRELNLSGLKSLSEIYTLDKYIPDNNLSAKLLEKAKEYIEDSPKWFFVSGRPGSGKTHICTAICLELINRGERASYMLWRDDSVKLKSAVAGDPEYYDKRIKQLKNVPVLYIDDLFKGGANGADIKLAFELLNYRYNQTQTRTIISTELDFKALRKIDDALASRIYKRSAGYCRRSPDRNYRIDPPCDITN